MTTIVKRQAVFQLVISIMVAICVIGTLSANIRQAQYAQEQRDIKTTQVVESRAWRSCMSTQFSTLADTLNARAEATQAKDEGTTAVFRAAARPGTRAEVRAALQIAIADYLAAQDDVLKARKDHPYPDYPNGVCK